MKQKFSIAMSLAVILAMLFTSIGLADQVQPDGDVVNSGNQGTVVIGIVSPGASISRSVSFTLECNGQNHVDNGQTLNLTFSLANSSVPSGGVLSAGNASIGPIPSTWPDDNSGCGSPNPAPRSDNGDSAVNITAPSAPGNYTYVVSYTKNISPPDVTGQVISVTFTLTVSAPPSNTAPSLTLPGNIVAEATSGAGAAVSYSASATDAEDDPDPSPSCSPASGSTFPLGSTTVNCSVTDAGGLSASGSFSVTVQDTTAPALTLPASVNAEATGASGAAVTYTASATDLVDGTVAVTCSPASGSTFAIGSTTVSCSATDAHSNGASGSFSIVVADTTAPILALPADITAEATGPSGAAVSYSASASDLVDGSITPSCSPASGSTFALGTTTVNCSATDAHSNTGNGSFTVTVQDTTAPAVTVPSDITAEATGPSGAAVTFTASALDTVDGAITPTCSSASGSTFPIGTTTVNCSATDAHGNTGSGSFTVTIQDTTPPTVTVPANITAEATGPSGAAVSYSASASDLVDGAVATTCSPTSGSTFGLGTTTVNCSATDAHGNTGHASFSVTVQDTTAPALTLPANMTVSATSAAGAFVTYSASANDIVDGVVAVSCTPASGSLFAPGTTTVHCSATDAHGNTNTGNFTVSVKFQLLGFYAPVDMGIHNIVKSGATVPLKFEVFAGSTELTSTSIISTFVQRTSCTAGPGDDIEQYATGGTSLRYDTTGGQFIFNWQSPKAAGSCYRVTVTTIDGSSIFADFTLK